MEAENPPGPPVESRRSTRTVIENEVDSDESVETGEYGSNLLPQHARQLAESAIAPEVAEARGYRSVETKAELGRLGFSAAQRRTPALLIPIHNVHGEVTLYQSRPDAPRIFNGKPIKYETPRGAQMLLDVPPVVRDRLRDPSERLLVTEGAKKADAAVSHGLTSISLLGVWNWRGTNNSGGKTVLADWESIALNDREVLLAFDSDVMDKPEVHAALRRLSGFLESRGARLRYMYLSPAVSGAKVGLDDYLAAGHSADEVLALAEKKLRPPPRDPEVTVSPPYIERPDGVWRKRPTREGPVEERLTNFRCRIVGDVEEDDGAEVRRAFELEAKLGGRTHRFEVPAARFAGMRWATEELGATAIVSPGMGTADHARAAIQSLSGKVPRRRLYAHTGWREVDGRWLYLHAGGAIGADGLVKGVETSLGGNLGLYELPDPPEGEELMRCVQASLGLLELAPERVSLPALTATYRAALVSADFSLCLAGPTGVFKTAYAALLQQHYGAEMDARHLPGGWSSTANALEGLAFQAKDALLVVDDFAPAGTAYDVARWHRDADRLLRGQGNRAGRQRMRPDGTLRPEKPPRGLIVSTGEDVPRGQSLRARFWTLELAHGDIESDRLTACQQDAAAGLYVQAMSGFIRWLAGRYEETVERWPSEVQQLRLAATASAMHRRTPDVAAQLAAGFALFLRFALETEALKETEASGLWERAWTALGEAAAAQGSYQSAAEPAGRFLELLAAAIASGRAHVAGPAGEAPDAARSWGWRRVGIEWGPQGERVGWVEGDDLYLEPDASYAVVQRLARDGGAALAVAAQTLRKRLREKEHLASVDEARRRLTIRKTLDGRRRPVLHLHCAALEPYTPEEPAHPAQLPPVRAHGPVPPFSWAAEGPQLASYQPAESPSYTGTSEATGRLGRLEEPEEAPERKEEQHEGQLELLLAHTGPKTGPPGVPQTCTSELAVEYVEGVV